MTGPSPLARLDELFAKVDAIFDRTAAAYPGAGGVTCASGCDDCCKKRLSLTRIEADAMVAGIGELAADEREALTKALRGRAPDDGACAALVDGRCVVYAFRPIVCRTHGLAIRFRDPERAPRALPILDACPRNFHQHDLATLPARDVLDQTTLSTVLGALDAAHADELGIARGARVDLADILSPLTREG